MALESYPYIAEHRFGYGPLAGQSLSGDPQSALLGQLQNIESPKELQGLDDPAGYMSRMKDFRREKRAGDQDDQAALAAQKASMNQQMRDFYFSEVAARFAILARTETPFYERLVWFWANHFCISGLKGKIVPELGAYERQAIRPYVNGYFSDLLLHAIQHPGMIMYLDNQDSVSPGLARHAAGGGNKPVGINENLAREIMELHTLGVDGGYSQWDVTSFAHALTGWSVDMQTESTFDYHVQAHDGQPQIILGRMYNQIGIEEGEAVLQDLALHPSTARHISTKLARHFIADDPPPAVVSRLSQTYTQTGGYLPAVYKALVESPEAWESPLTKAKSPVDYVASIMRLFPDAQPDPKKLSEALNQMGQKVWFAPSPQGWPDVSSSWITPDSLWKRVEIADRISSRVPRTIDARDMADAMYGPMLSDTTWKSIERAEDGRQALTLLLLSPEFQRR